jgi:putative ABC transport system permease protein
VESLRTNPLRTVLSTLGVIVGVAALVAILSIGDTLERFSREQIESTTDLLSIQILTRTTDRVDGIVVARSEPKVLHPADIEALQVALGSRARVTLHVIASSWVSVEGDSTTVAALVAATLPSSLDVLGSERVAGRFLVDADVADSAQVATLSQNLAARLAGGAPVESVVGSMLVVQGRPFRIVGVLGKSADGGASIVYVPLTVTLPALDGKYPEARVQATTIEEVESVREEVVQWLGGRFGDVESNFSVVSSQNRVVQAARAMMVFKLAMGAIAGISLLVGGIGIMNILLASVSERTREIGVRKSAGARRSDILTQFLAESVTITGIGAAIGVVLGLLASVVVTALIRTWTEAPVRATFTWTTVVVAAVAAIVVGLVFGTYPARRAAALSPSDAMRYE